MELLHSLLFHNLTCLPYQIISITAGVFNFNIVTFVLATIIFQGFRFFLLGWLIIKYGKGAKIIFLKNLKIITIVSVILILAIIVLTKMTA